MKRIGKFYFGWGNPNISFRPEMIVCRDERQAHNLRRKIGVRPDVRVVSPMLSRMCGLAPAKITVLPGVDLGRAVEGAGSLRALLRQRQATWGKEAVFIEL